MTCNSTKKLSTISVPEEASRKPCSTNFPNPISSHLKAITWPIVCDGVVECSSEEDEGDRCTISRLAYLTLVFGAILIVLCLFCCLGYNLKKYNQKMKKSHRRSLICYRNVNFWAESMELDWLTVALRQKQGKQETLLLFNTELTKHQNESEAICHFKVFFKSFKILARISAM